MGRFSRREETTLRALRDSAGKQLLPSEQLFIPSVQRFNLAKPKWPQAARQMVQASVSGTGEPGWERMFPWPNLTSLCLSKNLVLASLCLSRNRMLGGTTSVSKKEDTGESKAMLRFPLRFSGSLDSLGGYKFWWSTLDILRGDLTFVAYPWDQRKHSILS